MNARWWELIRLDPNSGWLNLDPPTNFRVIVSGLLVA
jgi:hypothetical protein